MRPSKRAYRRSMKMAIAEVNAPTRQSKMTRGSNMALLSHRALKVPHGLREFVGKWCRHRAMKYTMVCVYESTIDEIASFSHTKIFGQQQVVIYR
ncbi:hypothetical protein GCM10011408_02590 [Dyella caseinilytica]|nr:hypothetical protein GCM10011408_02590 [Dyella caseinilytica]